MNWNNGQENWQEEIDFKLLVVFSKIEIILTKTDSLLLGD